MLPPRDGTGVLPLPVRVRSGRAVAAFMAAVLLCIVVVRVAVPQAPGVGLGALLVTLGPLALLAVAAAVAPWHRRLRPGRQELVLHGLAAAPPVAVLGALVLVPTADPGGGLAFLPLLVVFFGVLLPPRSHVLFSVLLVAASSSLVGLDTVGWLALWPTVAAATVAVVVGTAASLHARSLHAAAGSAREAERTSEALRAVVDAGRASADQGPPAVLDAVAAAIVQIESDVGAVLVPAGDGWLHHGARRGCPDGAGARRRPSDVGVVGVAIASGRTVVCNDYPRHERALGPWVERGLRAVVAVPIIVAGELGGVLVAGRFDAGEYDEPVVRAMELLAGHAARALSLARLIDEDRRALEHLRAVERRQDAYVTTVSHELRTPVTIVDGLAQTLLDKADALDAATTSRLVERLAANSASLRGIVTSLLDTARLRDGLVPSRHPVDLEVLTRACVDRLAPLLADHDVRMTADAGAVVEGDPDLLQRVVDNLVANAVHHTPPGTEVQVGVRVAGGEVVVEVLDDGPGIGAALLPSVTQRFVRRHQAGPSGHRGLGIGLSLAQEILEAHGSQLVVTSDEGVGSRFAFTMPCS